MRPVDKSISTIEPFLIFCEASLDIKIGKQYL